MQSSREDFLELRERESITNPLPCEEAVETKPIDYLSNYKHDDLYWNSQYYHARPRIECESVLLAGGEYILLDPDNDNEWLMFQLEKYDPFQPGKFILTIRKPVYSSDSENSYGDYTQTIEVSTLRNIRPPEREEFELWYKAGRIEKQVFNKDGSKAYICDNISRKDKRTGNFNYYGKRFITE